MFADEYRRRLKAGKYTRWAKDLDSNSLQALLWMLGEAFRRMDPEWVALWFPTSVYNRGVRARIVEGLHTTGLIVNGDRLDVEEARRRIREAVSLADRPTAPSEGSDGPAGA